MEEEIQTHIDTKTIARMFGVKPASIHRSLSVRGHYLGLTPIKLKNKRLMWRLTAAKQIFGSW